MGISDATFYHWRKKYGKLKRLVGDLPVDQAMLQDDLSCASRDLI